MKIISWNVNGIRAALKKGFLDFFVKCDADVICLQETKIHDNDIAEELHKIGHEHGYESFWFGAEKKGYSGTAVFSRIRPVSVSKGFGDKRFDSEGRTIAVEFDKFFLIDVYAPNSKPDLSRLDEKIEFYDVFTDYCNRLRKKKPVVFCGDLNVAHEEIDIARPKENVLTAGFTSEERRAFSRMLSKGYVDAFRIFNKEPGNYTWWSYMFNARAKNIGWRIDYFIASEELRSKIFSSEILRNVMGSDHCPVSLEIIV